MSITIKLLASKTHSLQTNYLDSRKKDLACQLVVYERGDDGIIHPTGEESKVYGGVWDFLENRYTDEAPGKIIRFKVGKSQYDILQASMSRKYNHVLVIGSRRSSKTECLGLWCVLRLLELPGKPVCVVFQKHGKAKKFLERKVLPRVMSFILDGKEGFRRSPDGYGVTLCNGSVLEFLSAEVVNSPRGEGVASAGCDERQIIPKEIWDNVLLSLSEGDSDRDFCTFEVGTALEGEFQEYFDEVRQDPNFFVKTITAYDNPFISKFFLEDAKKHMDPRRYAQEVLAQFAPQGATVYHQFEKQTHVQPFADAKKVLSKRYGIYAGVGKDITGEVCYQFFREEPEFIIGMDFNVAPMVAVIIKVLKAPSGVNDIWWVIDEVILEDQADATRISIELKKSGYYPAIIIPDASGSRSEGGRSSHRMLRDEGFSVYAPKKNPHIPDRVNAVNLSLLNAAGHVTLFVDPKCRSLIRALQSQKIGIDGRLPEKDKIHEHRVDALGYPISFMRPAAIDWTKKRAVNG